MVLTAPRCLPASLPHCDQPQGQGQGLCPGPGALSGAVIYCKDPGRFRRRAGVEANFCCLSQFPLKILLNQRFLGLKKEFARDSPDSLTVFTPSPPLACSAHFEDVCNHVGVPSGRARGTTGEDCFCPGPDGDVWTERMTLEPTAPGGSWREASRCWCRRRGPVTVGERKPVGIAQISKPCTRLTPKSVFNPFVGIEWGGRHGLCLFVLFNGRENALATEERAEMKRQPWQEGCGRQGPGQDPWKWSRAMVSQMIWQQTCPVKSATQLVTLGLRLVGCQAHGDRRREACRAELGQGRG